MTTTRPTPVTSPLAPPPAGPYTSALRVGDLLFVSGHGPFGPDRQRLGTTFKEQAHVVFDNIEHLAREAGSSLEHTVRLGAFLSDLAYFDEWNQVCGQRLSEPYPTRTTVPVVLPRFDVEIDAVIWIPTPEES
ncbi:Rid family hydrolase [Nocardioides sp. LHD-245]|uniref:RidA family protein n=1 Tax=Nocardioides sp. LHD-245 TaxID=3051387 RepID=UPI0027E1E29C|nr:Rid family hydrolase [Nocardioides sp. LHD-245]